MTLDSNILITNLFFMILSGVILSIKYYKHFLYLQRLNIFPQSDFIEFLIHVEGTHKDNYRRFMMLMPFVWRNFRKEADDPALKKQGNVLLLLSVFLFVSELLFFLFLFKL